MLKPFFHKELTLVKQTIFCCLLVKKRIIVKFVLYFICVGIRVAIAHINFIQLSSDFLAVKEARVEQLLLSKRITLVLFSVESVTVTCSKCYFSRLVLSTKYVRNTGTSTN